MNILNVNFSIDPIAGGGTAERTLKMSKYLVDLGENCRILTCESAKDSDSFCEDKQIPITRIPVFSKRYPFPKAGFHTINRLVKEADLIHLMNHWSLLNAIVYFFAKFHHKPYVVCPAGALNIVGRSKILKKGYNALFGKKIIKNATGHIAVAANEIPQYQPYGVQPHQICLIPNGVDIPGPTCEALDGLKQPYILFLGRLNWIKGPDLLLEAFAGVWENYPDYHLAYAGPDGGMLELLKKRCKQLQLDHKVHFLGGVYGEQKDSLYKNCSFLVIPSRQEAMSIVVLEAGIRAKPALLTDTCGFNEVSQIKGGVVVEPTVDGLLSGLVEILSADLISMGANLQGHILQNYTWESVAQKIMRFYNQIVPNPRLYSLERGSE